MLISLELRIRIVVLMAKFESLYKKGYRKNINNYRPISITSSICRLLEKIILVRLTNYLTKNNIIIQEQSGFRKNRSTKDNLVFLIQKASEVFVKKQKLLSIFFDIKSAFDKVWHSGLIYKLYELKITVYIIKWITDFLSFRKYRIKVDNHFSDWFASNCGVPQGAVLSPKLFHFIIYTWIFNSYNLKIKPLCHTLSKADFMSKNILSSFCFLTIKLFFVR